MRGASGGGDFRDGDRAGAADDQVGLGESLRHIREEGRHLRVDFAPRIGRANGIIVALAGLVNDREPLFSAASKSSASTTARLMCASPGCRR